MEKAGTDAGSPSFHEDGVFFGKTADGSDYVVRAKPGENSDPSKDPYASTNVMKPANMDDLKNVGANVSGTFHTHPDGTVITETMTETQKLTRTSGFGNPPSDLMYNNENIGDIPNAKTNSEGATGNSYVLAQGNKTVYIYNASGTVATFSFEQFFSIGVKK